MEQEDVAEKVTADKLKDIKIHKLFLKNKLNLPDYVKFGFEIEALIDYKKLDKIIDQYNEENRFCNPNFSAADETTILFEENEYGGLDWSVGAEIITPILSDSEATWQDIVTACDYLKDNAECTENCSIHTNIGAEALGSNYKNWYNFCKIVAAIEPEIYRYLARGKSIRSCAINGGFRSSYAMPVAENIMRGLSKSDNVNDINVLLNNCGFNGTFQQRKDKSISLKALYEDDDNMIAPEKLDIPTEGQRIEFRMANGTFNPEEIQNDLYVIIKIIELARNLTPEKDMIVDRLLRRDLPENYNDTLDISYVLDVANLLFDSKNDKLHFLNRTKRRPEIDNTFSGKDEVLHLLKQGNMILELVPEFASDREVVLEAVKHGGAQLKYASEDLKNDREIVTIAISNYGRALEYAGEDLKNDRELVLLAVQNGLSLKGVNEKFKSDREVVLEAVKSNGMAVTFADKKFFDDKEIMFEVVKSVPSLIKEASDTIKDDEKIILRAVKNDARILKYASERIISDKKIMLEAVKRNALALGWASAELKADREFVLKAVKADGRAIICVSESENFASDREIVLEAAKTYPRAILFASSELSEDKEFCAEVERVQKKERSKRERGLIEH